MCILGFWKVLNVRIKDLYMKYKLEKERRYVDKVINDFFLILVFNWYVYMYIIFY